MQAATPRDEGNNAAGGRGDARDPVELLVEEYFERRRGSEGSGPSGPSSPTSIDEFARRVPGREVEFRKLVEMMELLESGAARPASSKSDGRAAALSAVESRERLGRFRLIRVIGRGGMGVVYEAVDDELARHVALKVLPGHSTLDEREIARFRREAQAAARLNHPHIVPVHGVGEEQGTHWLAMQLIPGESLEGVLRRKREAGGPSRSSMDPREVARHGLAIAQALACAHAEGVLHRDVKPSNLLLDPSGTIWITDFGLAKSTGTATLTRTGETVGTPRYMAPEAFSGWADPRTDVWGVGATLYELLAGRPAFDGGDRAQLLKQISDVEPPPLRKLDPAIPRDLATIAHKCLQKEPAARYATAEELAADLRRFLAGEPIRARPPSLAYRIGLIGRRHPTATTLLLVALALGVVMTLREARRARTAEQTSQRRFDDLRKLAGTFLFEVHEAIRNLPGSTRARELVVKRSLEYLDGLAAESADDPALRRELAAAYQKVGDVQGNPYQPNLGDVVGARRSYATAIALLEPIVASGDASDEDRALLASACLVGGGIELAGGPAPDALAMTQRGLDLRKALAARDPSRARREELATAWQYASFSLSGAGRHEEAFDAMRQQATILRELLSERPDDPQLRRAWGNNRYLTAHALLRQRDLEGAKAAYAETIELRRALLAADPANTALRRDLAMALMDFGSMLADRGDLTSSSAVVREVLAIQQSLAAADPESTDARLGVQMARNNLGNTLLRMGKPEEALEHLPAAIEIAESVLAADPANVWAERMLASACLNEGAAYAALGDSASLEEACDLYLRAREILERMKTAGRLRDPKDPMLELVRKGLAECEARLAK